jgi:multidrug efflux pump
MTRIVDWAVNNTRVVLGLLVVVIIAGISAFVSIPKEAQPDIPIPVIMVEVPYPGISPEDSERLLVKPMETYLRSIQGLKDITARAYQGMAVMILEFDVNFDKEKALEDVRAQVETARAELPSDSKQPIVQEFNTSLFPVITAALYGNVPERTLLHLARDLKDRLKQLPTVLDVDIGGERQEMLEIIPDPAKMEAFGITQQEMFNAISNNNRLIAAGSRRAGDGRGRPGSAHSFDQGRHNHAEGRGAGSSDILRPHQLCDGEWPAHDLAGRVTTHRRERDPEQSGGAGPYQPGREILAGGRSRRLHVR